MTCMEVDGVKRVLTKVILPLALIGIWTLTCYPVCNKPEGFDLFMFWILVGFPFGMKKMCMFLIPVNYGISGSIGVLALNGIIGGLIGGIVVIFKLIGVVIEIVKLILDQFIPTVYQWD